jgi:hypothetical protein
MSAAIDIGNDQPLCNSKLSGTIVLRTIGLKQPQYSGGRRYSGSKPTAPAVIWFRRAVNGDTVPIAAPDAASVEENCPARNKADYDS